MATTHAPGTGIGPHGGKNTRRAAIIAAVVLASAAIVVPFAVHGLDRDGATASAATHVSTPSHVSHSGHQQSGTDAALGPRGSLPALLPGSTRLAAGTHVRLGDLTSGVLRRTPDGTWQVMVRWNGRIQPVSTRGPVALAPGSAAHGSVTWISGRGLLYTRVPSGGHGQFQVFAWDPRGATAYTPPTLFPHSLGKVCFNRSFTAFGDCSTAG